MNVTADQIQAYRQDGFVKIPGLLPRNEAFAFREAALAAGERLRG